MSSDQIRLALQRHVGHLLEDRRVTHAVVVRERFAEFNRIGIGITYMQPVEPTSITEYLGWLDHLRQLAAYIGDPLGLCDLEITFPDLPQPGRHVLISWLLPDPVPA